MLAAHRTAHRVVLLALLGGCSLVNDPGRHQGGAGDGGPTDGGGAGPTPIPIEDFCQRYAELACEAVGRCCSALTEAPTGCLMQQRELCGAFYGGVISDGRVEYDPVLAAMGLEQGRQIAAACGLSLQGWFLARDGFVRGIRGTIAGGEECTPRNNTDYYAYLSCASAGQSCIASTDSLSSCTSRRARGQPCTFLFDCQEGLRCERGPTIFGMRRCGPGEPAFSECFRADECASLECDGADAFGLTPGRCAPVPMTADDVYCPGE